MATYKRVELLQRSSILKTQDCFQWKSHKKLLVLLLHIKVRLLVLLYAVKTVEGDFRFAGGSLQI